MGMLSLCCCEARKIIVRRFRGRERAGRPQQSGAKFVKKMISRFLKNYW